ncbi:MAG: hypothetical protein HQL39_04110 [Alphaproteobacteria bacterium]|nr:hypothetical protein [Alphaproteobacteria bacterium]
MPIHKEAEALIRKTLEVIAARGKAESVIIGYFTSDQHAAINNERARLLLPPVESPDIVYIGRHHYKRRSEDGYSIDDMVAQAVSALHESARPILSAKMTATRNPNPRDDGYGNMVYDEAVFECTARKPHAELFSVIPKGDVKKPPKR